ncbi:MAG: OmpA family protein [bacterium]
MKAILIRRSVRALTLASAISAVVGVTVASAGEFIPDQIQVDSATKGSVSLSWDAVTTAATPVIYQVGYNTDNSGGYTNFTRFVDQTSGTITGLEEGKVYYFAIKTDIANQEYAFSPSTKVSTEQDSDNDGIYDSAECVNWTADPAAQAQIQCPDTDNDGRPNNEDDDDDGDGILTKDELAADGSAIDSDADSLPDYLEPNNIDTNGNGEANHQDADDDGDTASNPQLTTEFEVDGKTLFPPDVDADGIYDYLDGDSTNGAGTEDGSGDSDGDGASDKQECSTPPFCTEDLDGDGVPDYLDNTDDRVVPEAIPPTGPLTTGLDGVGGGSFGVFGLLLGFVAWLGRNAVRRRGVLAALALLMAGGAQAGTSQWYLGGGIGQSSLDPVPGDPAVTVRSDSDLGLKLFGGYDFTNHLTLEGFLADLGAAELSNKDDVSYRLYGLTGLVYLRPSLPGGNGFLKAGVSTLDNSADTAFQQENDTQAFVGLGAEYQFESGISVRAAYEYFADDARLLSVSLMRRFGEVYTEPEPEVKVVEVEKVPPVDGDADNDGIPDSMDQCPDTTPGVEVDAKGCEFDLDGDGVLNEDDQCPSTPKGMPVHADGCPMFTGVLEGVHFETAKTTLTERSKKILDKIADQMMSYPELNVVVVGHTDSVGSDEYNKKLSVGRAKSVADYLLSRGVSASRLRYAGYGEKYPRASNDTEQGKALNRRVELLPRK